MENEEYAIAYKEVSEILKYIPIFDYEKIPREKIELYIKRCKIEIINLNIIH